MDSAAAVGKKLDKLVDNKLFPHLVDFEYVPPNYSSEVECAMTVFQELVKSGRYPKLMFVNDNKFQCNLYNPTVTVVADTIPLAICLATLK